MRRMGIFARMRRIPMKSKIAGLRRCYKRVTMQRMVTREESNGLVQFDRTEMNEPGTFPLLIFSLTPKLP
jgi:hypothetical protein